jgi:hypothetical protein
VALNLSNLETILQNQVNNLDGTSTDKDILLTAKSIEAATADIVVSDVIAEGSTQVNAVNTAGSTQIGSVNSAGGTQVTAVQNAGTTQIAAVNAIDSYTKAETDSKIVSLSPPTDLSQLENNIAMLGFFRASDNSKAKYSLVDQVVDEYSNSTGIDTANSSNENLSGGYYSGGFQELGSSVTKEFASTNPSWAVTAGTIIDKIIVIGGGGAGGQRDLAGQDRAGAGGGGGGWIGGVNYTIPAGITSSYVTVGNGGTGGGANNPGNAGQTSSIVFGSDLTLSASGGAGGLTTVVASSISGGAGGSASLSGTSSGSLEWKGLSGGAGGSGAGQGQGGIGSNGDSGTLSGTTYTAAGGGGGGSGNALGDRGGNGNSASYSGGGGGAGGDAANVNAGPNGGSGYGYAGEGASIDGQEDGGTKTVDGVTVAGGIGSLHNPGSDPGSLPERRDRNNAGGGGLFGGGGGGIGDGGVGIAAAHGAQGYVRVEYRPMTISALDLILQSTSSTASTAPSTGDIVMLIENSVGIATINTDIKGYVSRDNGTTWAQGTLIDEGSWGTNKKILAFHNLDISGQPSGTSMKYKVTTHNQSVSKETKIHATSLAWA